MIPDLTSVSTKREFDPLHIDVLPTSNVGSAEIAVVSDAVSWSEVHEGRILGGSAGGSFSRLCSAINLPQYQVYFTAACKAQIERGKISKWWSSRSKYNEAWRVLQQRLIEELAGLSTNVIVLLGDLPMHMLLDSPGIDSANKYRGSVYKASDFPHLSSLGDKLICITEHPSKLNPGGDPKLFYVMMHDFNKFLALRDHPEYATPEVILHTRPTFHDAMEFLSKVLASEVTAFDIEATPQFVTCFGFSISSKEAMCIPLMDNSGDYWTLEEELAIWQKTAEILASPKVKKIMQNGMFDTMYMLRRMDFQVENFSFDTMLAQHLCWTDLPKGLDFLTSVYTYMPYYKDDGKEAHLKLIKDWDMYWQYNAKDCVATHKCAIALAKEIDKLDIWNHMEYQMKLHKPLMEMEYRGLKVQPEGIETMRKEMEEEIVSLQNELDTIVGHSLNINSSAQMIKYFYGDLLIKPYINRKTGRPTTDSVALHRIAKKGKKGSEEAHLILKLRKLKKLVSTYFTIPIDDDNRLRATYKIGGTSSGRLASAKTFFGTGMNLQNQPPIIKKFFVADDNMLMAEFDLARAEAHLVAYLSQDENMMRAFTSGIDVHTYNAAEIFHITMEEVTKEHRNLGKRVVHASNYAMGPMTFSDNLAKDDYFLSMGECRNLLNAYAKRFPGLPRWQKSIDQEVSKTRMLYNLFGRPKRFLGMLNSAMFRNAYSYIPQSTIAELLNRSLIKMYEDPWFTESNIQFLTTVHDSVVLQFPKQEKENLSFVQELCQKVQEHLSHTFTVKGRSFMIGLDGKIGYAWGRDYVELPDFSIPVIENALQFLNVPL